MIRVLSFDQSITATGWGIIDFDEQSEWSRPLLVAKGTIKTAPKEGMKGYHDTVPRTDTISRGVQDILAEYGRTIGCAVHEMPAVPAKGRRGSGETKVFEGRTDASLMACIAVRSTIHTYSRSIPLVMVSAQAMKRTMTGLQNAEKEEMRAAVWTELGEEIKMNLNVSDAIGNGMGAWKRGLVIQAINEMAGAA